MYLRSHSTLNLHNYINNLEIKYCIHSNCYIREIVGVLWVVGETGCLPGVLQPPAQLSLLVAQPVVSEEAGGDDEC